MELFDTIITEQAKWNVQACLESGHLSEGKLVRQFEFALENSFGYKNCVAVNSGTAALHLVLHEIGVSDGDEVIIPAQTFIATGMAVLQCGGKVVFADIELETGNISVDDVREKITWRTKAVIAVSWGGNPCDLDALQALCQEKNIYLIQDNAQALGATYKGKPVTEWGDFSCFSFQATKHLTTGDGGLIVANSPTDQRILKNLRWFNIDRELDLPDETGERQYYTDEYGFKYHMNDYSAALGLGNLVGIHERIVKRKAISRHYRVHIDYGGHLEYGDGSSCWIYDMLNLERNNFFHVMKERGIPVSVVHVGIDKHYNLFGDIPDLPNQRYWDEHHVCLPCHSSMDWEDVEKVVDAVNRGW
jgi:perosamine synthetase